MKNGWHVLYGCDVYVEDGKVLRGLKNGGTEPAYVYRKCRSGGWDRETAITVAAFRAGVRRGTIDLR